MQAIFGLLPDHGVRRIHQLGADLLAAVGGQAVHIKGVAGGPAHQFSVHLIGREHPGALELFLFLAHGSPYIRHDQVRALRGNGGVVLDAHPVPVRLQQHAVGLKPGRAGDAQFKIELPGRVDVGLAHIIAVADPAHALAGAVATVLDPGLHVRQ